MVMRSSQDDREDFENSWQRTRDRKRESRAGSGSRRDRANSELEGEQPLKKFGLPPRPVPAVHRGHLEIDRKIRQLFPEGRGFSAADVGRFLEANSFALNAVSLANVLTRLAERPGDRAQLQDTVLADVTERALLMFLADEIKAGPREISSAWRVVASFGVTNGEILASLAEKTTRLLGVFGPLDFGFTAMGLAASRGGEQSVPPLLARACQAFRSRMRDFEPEAAALFLKALSQGDCTDQQLAIEVAAYMLEPRETGLPRGAGDNGRVQLQLDTLSLDSMGTLLRSLAIVQAISIEILDAVTERLEEAFLRTGSCGKALPRAKGAGDYLWAAVAMGYDVPPALKEELSCHIHSEFDQCKEARQREILSSVAMPALLAVGMNSPRVERSFRQLEKVRFEQKSPSSSLEIAIGTTLGSLGVAFELEHPVGPYRLDFLLKLPGGRIVNLEADGDAHHLLRDVSSNKLLAAYRGQDVVRDRVMESLGMEVVRVLASEWNAAPDKAKYIMARLGLP